MLEEHRTKDGNVMLIAEMTDSHLKNTIKLFIRKMMEVRHACATQPELGPMERAMYGISEADPTEGGRLLRVITQKLYPYLAELFLRGIDEDSEIRLALVEAVGGRSHAVVGAVIRLVSNIDDDDLDDTWGHDPHRF